MWWTSRTSASNRYPAEGGGEPSSFRLDLTQGIPIRFDVDGSGRLVVQLRALGLPGAAGPGAGGGDAVVVLDATGAVADTLVVLPAGESLTLSGGSPRLRMFASESVWDLDADGRFVSGRSDHYRIEERGADGTLTRVLTRPFQRRPLTEADQGRIQALMRTTITNQGFPPAAVEQVLSQMQFAEYYPAFAALMAGPRGSTWVQRVRMASELEGVEELTPEDIGTPEWEVLDAEGRYIGVCFAPRTRPVLFDGDSLYAIVRGEFDVPVVVRFRVGMPGG
jgi:hypothetical protein